MKNAEDYWDGFYFKGNNPTDKETVLPKSLRRDLESVGQFNEFGVTQDFKNFVAKQLAKSLDKSVEEINGKNGSLSKEKKKKKKRENTLGGIKLTSDSKIYLNEIENDNKEQNIDHNKRWRKKLRSGDNFVQCISKCREVAVQSDWILSKVSTAMWTDRQKGTVYYYKKSDNGGLIEINEFKT